MEKVLFKEEQRMHHLKLIIVLPFLFFIILISWLVRLNYHGNAVAFENITSNEFLIFCVIIFLVLAGLLIYIHRCSLKTKISNKEICVRYMPQSKDWMKISVAQIRSYRIRKYNPIREYYGHGKRNHRKHGKAYTVSGKEGLQIYLRDGTKLLIGTQKRQAIEYAMEKLMREGNSI